MAQNNVAELFIETLVQAGVERVYGLPGDSLNGITESFRKQKKIKWIHVRHEETAAFAAETGIKRGQAAGTGQTCRPTSQVHPTSYAPQ